MREGADTAFVWTDELKETAARSSLAVEAVRRGHLTGEEALISVITGKPDTPEYMAAIEERKARIPFPAAAPARERRTTPKEDHRTRERERYHSDPEYRERCLARHRAKRQRPEWKERERERGRRRRAAAREAKRA